MLKLQRIKRGSKIKDRNVFKICLFNEKHSIQWENAKHRVQIWHQSHLSLWQQKDSMEKRTTLEHRRAPHNCGKQCKFGA